MMPTNVLLNWLYYHGLPMPKGASKAVLVQKVKLALAHNQELDRERISLDKAVNRKSYISWETMSISFGITQQMQYSNSSAVIPYHV